MPLLSESEFDSLRKTIYEASGIAIGDGKIMMLSGRIRKRLRALEMNSFGDYLKLLATCSDEITGLMDVVSTNETSFFRTPSHFEWFESTFLASLGESKGPTNTRTRIWSAACSTGAEPLTIAMVLEQYRRKGQALEVDIVASDISVSAIAQAESGTYAADRFHSMPPEYRRHVQGQDQQCVVDSAIRDQVQYRVHNLMHPVGFGTFDLIFLRNVLIYFDTASKAVAMGHIRAALKPSGYLVIGPSEGVFRLPSGWIRRSSFLLQREEGA